MFGTTGFKTFALPFGITLGVGAAAGFLYYSNVEKITWLRIRRPLTRQNTPPPPPLEKTAKKTSKMAARNLPTRILSIFDRPPPKKTHSEPPPKRHRWHQAPLGYTGPCEITINPLTYSLPPVGSSAFRFLDVAPLG